MFQLVAEGKISQEDYLKLAPNKGRAQHLAEFVFYIKDQSFQCILLYCVIQLLIENLLLQVQAVP